MESTRENAEAGRKPDGQAGALPAKRLRADTPNQTALRPARPGRWPLPGHPTEPAEAGKPQQAAERHQAERAHGRHSTRAYQRPAGGSQFGTEHLADQFSVVLMDAQHGRRWRGGPIAQHFAHQRQDALGELLREIRDMTSIDEALALLKPELENLQASWPSDPRFPEGAMPNLTDPTLTSELLEDVKQLLLPRLLIEGSES